jgi:hypothetical protein
MFATGTSTSTPSTGRNYLYILLGDNIKSLSTDHYHVIPCPPVSLGDFSVTSLASSITKPSLSTTQS